MPWTLESVRLVREALRADQAVVGFAGGPFTVAGYLIEGKPSREFKLTKACMYSQPEVWHALMEKLADAFALYVAACAGAGADAIQLFDSWAGALSVADYREFVAPYSARVLEAVDVPTIHFATGDAHLLEERAAVGGDVIGVDWRVPLDVAWERGRPRPRHPGQPRRRRAARALGAGRGGNAARARARRAGGRPHLQPRPRRAAGDRPCVARQARRARARDDHGPGMSDAVILMAYGSPATAEDIRPYFEDVRGGRPVSDEAVAELAERYRRIGGRSPLDEMTEAQRAALERELGIPVFVGMKHWQPRIAEAVERALDGGATRLIGVVLAPHFSRMSVGEYRERLEVALDGREAELVLVESWHDDPAFVDVRRHPRARNRRLGRLHRALAAGADPGRRRPLPRAAARDLAPRRRARAGLGERWSFAFQSASPTGEPWLGPDILDELERLHGDGVGKVLVAPVGFVSDHLEILWDLEIEAREKAGELGLELERMPSLNDDPAFIAALAGVVERARVGEPAVSGRSGS